MPRDNLGQSLLENGEEESDVMRDPNTKDEERRAHSQESLPLQPGRGHHVAFCSQLGLSGACFGLELIMTFVSVYAILSLQYLGVPVSLVGVHGIICSCASLVLIPLIGRLTDEGSNVKVRKAISLMTGLGLLLTAMTFISVSSAIKLNTTGRHDNQTTPCHNCTAPPEDNPDFLPVTGLLAILGFAFLDMSFDVSMAPTRAFILESVPSSQHSGILATSTVAASLAGVLLATMGFLDVPLLFARLVNTAGYDNMAISLMFLCGFIAFVTACSFFLTLFTGFRIMTNNDTKKLSEKLHLYSGVESQYPSQGDVGVASRTNTSDSNDSTDEKETIPSSGIKSTELPRSSDRTNTELPVSNENTPPVQDGGQQNESFFKVFSKRLVILLLACFFSFGTMLTFLTFSSNSLTISVYRGEPSAPAGSDARLRYEEGLRMSSVGVVTYYVLYFVISSFSNKILEKLGPITFFLLTNGAMALTCLAFALTSHLAAYFAAMFAVAAHKCMSYTVPFLMVTRYSQVNGNTATSGNQKLGKVTSLIGFLLPAASLFISATMGPLMAYVSSAWPPMYFCVASSGLACLVMALLYIVK